MYIVKILSLLFKVNIWKTIYVNLIFFPLKVAVKCPVLVYNRVIFNNICLGGGKIVLQCTPRIGMIKIGVQGLGIVDHRYTRTILNISGTIICGDNVFVGRGSCIEVGKGATLSLGDDFCITGRSSILCTKDIKFGNGCLLSWDILIMDTDWHSITSSEGVILNKTAPIAIGDHVWIGCRCLVLKGVTIADHVVIAANSTVTRNVLQKNIVYGDARILKSDIDWIR